MEDTSRKKWELENSIDLVDPQRDALYQYSPEQQKAINDERPWRSNPSHFRKVRISAVALLKMVMHARSGGSLEVMGLMQGSIHGDTFVVTDAFRLPVEGTETRVNAQDEANEYMVGFLAKAREQGQLENAVGWYHSHPGYGCWLSGIDVSTQHTQQMFQDPFVAVVIDPDRTISAGKVEIGAFRTYPENYKPSTRGGEDGDGFQAIPLDKSEDFGAHADRYYSLEVSHFKSTLDSRLLASLWNKYWHETLSSNELLLSRDFATKQMEDLARKIKKADASQPRGSGLRSGKENDLEALVKAGSKISAEETTGIISARVKDQVFSVSAAESQAS